MRVIAGTARRLPLIAPEGKDTRPTTDRSKRLYLTSFRTMFPERCFWIYLVEVVPSGLKH